MSKPPTTEVLRLLRLYVRAWEEHREAVRAQQRARAAEDRTLQNYQAAWRTVKGLTPAHGAYRIGELIVLVGEGDYPTPTPIQAGD